MLRGHPQLVHVYGDRSGTPVIVSSGDGGWIHLGAARRRDARRARLLRRRLRREGVSRAASRPTATRSASMTCRATIGALVDYAARGSPARPILIGVSEGAGLSVLAASIPRCSGASRGVVALGLPDRNELGWRWKDSLIYVTHGVPNEPTFSAGATSSARLTPVPLAAIHSTRDEFVPESDVRRADGAGERAEAVLDGDRLRPSVQRQRRGASTDGCWSRSSG